LSKLALAHRIETVNLVANFMGYLTEANQLLDKARMLNDEANRSGLRFVTTELAVSRALPNEP